MKHYFFIILSLLFWSCSGDDLLGENLEQQMMIYGCLKNSECDNQDVCGELASYGYIAVDYYPAVSQTTFNLNGLEIYSDDYSSMTGRTWNYDEDQLNPDENLYEWVTGQDYELSISCENNLYNSIGTCQVPGSFIINEEILPDEINMDEGFSLNWSTSSNATHYRINLFFLNDNDVFDESPMDSLIILDKDINSIDFNSEILEPFLDDDFYALIIDIESVNGAIIDAGSEGNMSEYGNGYFYGSFDPSNIVIYNENSSQINRSITEELLKKIEIYGNLSFKKFLDLQ